MKTTKLNQYLLPTPSYQKMNNEYSLANLPPIPPKRKHHRKIYLAIINYLIIR